MVLQPRLLWVPEPCVLLLYASEGMWPRLQVSQVKPHWLQVDFEHYVDDGDSEEGEGGGAEEADEPAHSVSTLLWQC